MEELEGAQSIGQKVRRVRQRRGLTLRAVEQRAHVSATHISEIERGKTSPTVGVIARIASALNVPVAELLDVAPVEGPHHQTPRDRRCLTRTDSGAQIEGLTALHGASTMSVHLVSLRAEGRLHEGAHDGEELCHVLEGAIEVRLDGMPHIVRRRETFHFRPRKEHEIRNATRSPARFIWVARPRVSL